MSVQIDYMRASEFLGRNGVFCMTGLLIEEGESSLRLYPVTSKGVAGRAFLSIPQEKVLEVTQELMRLSQGMNAGKRGSR